MVEENRLQGSGSATQKDPQFSNGQRIIDLSKQVGHTSDYTEQLNDAMEQGQLSWERAHALTTSLERHKALEDEVKSVKATIKSIENKRDDLVQQAREKISDDEARVVIIERLRQRLMDTYLAYLRADQRACIKAIENLWDKYAVTAKTIEAERDAASQQLQEFLVELGYA